MLLKRNGLHKIRMKQGNQRCSRRMAVMSGGIFPSRRIVHDRDIEVFGLEWQPVIVLFGNILVWIVLQRCVW